MTRRLQPTGRGRSDGGRVAAARESRAGSTIVESVVSLSLLGTVLVTIVPIVRWAANERRQSERRQFALEEVSNVMERVALLPWEAIDPDSVGRAAATDLRQWLPGARLEVQTAGVPGPPPLKRVTIELTWHDRTGQAVVPVRLTAWFHRPDGGE